MSTWYYYDKDGQKQGPITGGQLKGLAKTGQISPETVVETEGGKTSPARKVSGLTFMEVAPSETMPTGQNPFNATPPVADSTSASVAEKPKKTSISGKFVAFLSANLWRTIAMVLVVACLLLVTERYVSWEHPSDLVGEWKFDTGSGSYGGGDLKLLQDGTGKWRNGDITWKVESRRLHLIPVSRANTWDYTKSNWGSTLTLTEGNNKMVYKKQE